MTLEDPFFERKQKNWVSSVQAELWSRNYGFSWGTAYEFRELLDAHPMLLTLTPGAGADAILLNLSEWSETLAAKEAKARPAFISPENATALADKIQKLRQSAVASFPVGPKEANTEVIEFNVPDCPSEPRIGWAVFSGELFLGRFGTKDAAWDRARRAVERAVCFKTTVEVDRGRNAIRITAKQLAPELGNLPCGD